MASSACACCCRHPRLGNASWRASGAVQDGESRLEASRHWSSGSSRRPKPPWDPAGLLSIKTAPILVVGMARRWCRFEVAPTSACTALPIVGPWDGPCRMDVFACMTNTSAGCSSLLDVVCRCAVTSPESLNGSSGCELRSFGGVGLDAGRSVHVPGEQRGFFGGTPAAGRLVLTFTLKRNHCIFWMRLKAPALSS